MRAWVDKQEIKPKKNTPNSPGYKILAELPSIKVDFTDHVDAVPKSVEAGLIRWQKNPTANWGPRPRARQAGDTDSMEKRRLDNQGKRKRRKVGADA